MDQQNDLDNRESIMAEQQRPSKTTDFEFPSSPSKRQKTLTQSSILSSKGKEKIEEEEDDEAMMDSDSDKICGICFSEDGNAIRGSIDSCNHYFCFVCIMEWSKVESRCPMCKQRFKTIIRPPKDGVFLSERIVNVPLRDQVWHPLGNISSGPSDPYARVNCTECQSSLDENLLLLCDLCDSAAHTYCVGLGSTVPEGDWYCQDCTLSRDNHNNSQLDTDFYDQGSRNSDTTLVARESVSIFEIVKETYPTVPKTDICTGTEVTDPNLEDLPRCSNVRSRSSLTAITGRKIISVTRATDTSVRTLRRCRDVQSHIKAFRENWNALRNGSLGFSTCLTNSDSKNSRKPKSKEVVYDKNSQPQSSSGLQTTTFENVAGNNSYKNNSYDTDKAWKMLDIAKSVKRAREGNRTTHRVSNYLSGEISTPGIATGSSSNFSTSKIKLPQQKELGQFASENKLRSHPSKIGQVRPKSPGNEKKNSVRHAMKDSEKSHKGGPCTTNPSIYYQLASPKQAQISSAQVDVHRQNGKKFPMQLNCETSSGNISEPAMFDSTASPNESSLVNSRLPYSRSEVGASSSCKAEPPKGKYMLDKSSAKVTARNDGDAKSEIQSLVKLNLKLLCKDKKLGVNEFKEVARVSTHTILAACGLEHSKSSVHGSFHHSLCSHNDIESPQQQELRMSNLMPNSCRECFYVFVKDVVSSILTEKVTVSHSNS